MWGYLVVPVIAVHTTLLLLSPTSSGADGIIGIQRLPVRSSAHPIASSEGQLLLAQSTAEHECGAQQTGFVQWDHRQRSSRQIKLLHISSCTPAMTGSPYLPVAAATMYPASCVAGKSCCGFS